MPTKARQGNQALLKQEAMGLFTSCQGMEASPSEQVLHDNTHGHRTHPHTNRESKRQFRRIWSNTHQPKSRIRLHAPRLGNPDVGHYCAVFDEYRVDKVEIYQTPRATEASVINVVEPTGGSNPGYWNAVIHWATECEPQLAVPPNAVAVMQQQDSYFNTDQTKAAKFSHSSHEQCFGSNGTTGGIILTAAPATQWISCQDLNAQWNGIQWYADPCTNTDLLPGGTLMTISLGSTSRFVS